MTVTMKLKGGAELQAALRALANSRAITNAGRQALRAAARPIQQTAIALAPEDQGILKQSIKLGAGKVAKGGDRDNLTVVVGIDRSIDPPSEKPRAGGKGTYRDPGVAGHSVIIEFGRAGAPAQPYMTPAWDQHAPLTPERVAEALWPAIERQAARLAKAGK